MGSTEWVSARLGVSRDTFFRKRDALLADGFPAQDPLLRLWIKADVDAWIERRRRISTGVDVRQSGGEPEIDEGAL